MFSEKDLNDDRFSNSNDTLNIIVKISIIIEKVKLKIEKIK